MSEPGERVTLERALAALRDPDPERRERAVRRLRVIGGPAALAAIMGALDDPAEEVRARAAIALGQMEACEVVPALIERLRNATSVEAGATGAFALSQIGGTSALQPLINALDDPSEQVVTIACHALADLDQPGVVEPIRPLLSHPAWSVRAAACSTLISLGVGDHLVEAALDRLKQESEGRTYSRRLQSIRRALDRLRDEEHIHQGLDLDAEASPRAAFETAMAQLRQAEPEARVRAVHRLSGLGGAGAIAALIGALGDPAAQVRSSAAVALGQMRSPDAISALAAHLSGDESAHVRLMCVSSLATQAVCSGSLSSDEKQRITDALMTALAEPDWKMLLPAIWGLRRIGDPRAIPMLLQLLDHSQRSVRYGSARALLELRVADRRLVTAWEKLLAEPEAVEHDLDTDEWNNDLEAYRQIARDEGQLEPEQGLKMHEVVEQARQLLAQAQA